MFINATMRHLIDTLPNTAYTIPKAVKDAAQEGFVEKNNIVCFASSNAAKKLKKSPIDNLPVEDDDIVTSWLNSSIHFDRFFEGRDMESFDAAELALLNFECIKLLFEKFKEQYPSSELYIFFSIEYNEEDEWYTGTIHFHKWIANTYYLDPNPIYEKHTGWILALASFELDAFKWILRSKGLHKLAS